MKNGDTTCGKRAGRIFGSFTRELRSAGATGAAIFNLFTMFGTGVAFGEARLGQPDWVMHFRGRTEEHGTVLLTIQSGEEFPECVEVGDNRRLTLWWSGDPPDSEMRIPVEVLSPPVGSAIKGFTFYESIGGDFLAAGTCWAGYVTSDSSRVAGVQADGGRAPRPLSCQRIAAGRLFSSENPAIVVSYPTFMDSAALEDREGFNRRILELAKARFDQALRAIAPRSDAEASQARSRGPILQFEMTYEIMSQGPRYVGLRWSESGQGSRSGGQWATNLALSNGEIRELSWTDLGPDGDALFRAVAVSARSRVLGWKPIEFVDDPDGDFRSQILRWFALPDGFLLRIRPVKVPGIARIHPAPRSFDTVIVPYDAVRHLMNADGSPLSPWIHPMTPAGR